MAAQVGAGMYVEGVVQGVGYRGFAEMAAAGLHLTGYVRNLRDGRVQVEVEGDRGAVEAFVRRLKQGPRAARVTAVKVTWRSASDGPTGGFGDFSIRY